MLLSVIHAADCTTTALQLETPNLWSENIIECKAGLRPVRETGMRLEVEQIGNKTVIHDYGHGGAGISVSWGCANEAVKLMEQRFGQNYDAPIAVIGCGIIGLCTAHELIGQGYKFVTVYAENFPPNTTSDVAVGFWGPNFMLERGETKDERARFKRITDYSYQKLSALANDLNPEFKGVRYLNVYEFFEGTEFPKNPIEIQLSNGVIKHATCERKLMMGGEGYIQDLYQKASQNGVEMNKFKVATPNDLLKLPEDIIFNCTGLGSRAIFNDEKLVPVRGQLIYFKPQEGINFGLHKSGKPFFVSIIPFHDRIVVGGVCEPDKWSCESDFKTCLKIIENARNALCT
jgi:D-amino-acid oxidase